MRVLVLIKANADSEAGVMPSDQLLQEMEAYNDALTKAGVMVLAEGLYPSKVGHRVHFGTDGSRTVHDGPFAETKELLAGYWIWQVETMEEAVEWVKKIPNPDNTETTVELRRVATLADFQ